MAPVIGYWKLRGILQPITLLMEYVGDEYELKFYKFGPAPEYDRSDWFSVKYDLGLTLPNLPYYIDGDIKITMSNAIMRHIAQKHNLCGTNEQERVRVDILENSAWDFRSAYIQLAYFDYDTKKEQYFDNLPNILKSYSDTLGDKTWFVGDNITFPDFLLYELFAIHKIIASSCLDAFPNLQAFMKRFEELPAIKKHMASTQFISSPLNGPMAFFGGK